MQKLFNKNFELLKNNSVLCTPFFEHEIKRENDVKNLSDYREKGDYGE